MILLIKVHKIQQNSSIGDCPEKYVHSNEIMEQKIESKAQNKTCDATEHMRWLHIMFVTSCTGAAIYGPMTTQTASYHLIVSFQYFYPYHTYHKHASAGDRRLRGKLMLARRSKSYFQEGVLLQMLIESVIPPLISRLGALRYILKTDVYNCCLNHTQGKKDFRGVQCLETRLMKK